jgi:hypothetical protein
LLSVSPTVRGYEEILNRRIGSNELDAITICRGFDEAQHEYAQELRDDSKVYQYAQKILSTPVKHASCNLFLAVARGN